MQEDNGGFIAPKEWLAMELAKRIIEADIFLATYHPEKHKMPTEKEIEKIINDCRKAEGLDIKVFKN